MAYEYQEIRTSISNEEAHELIEKVARFIAVRGLAPAGIMLIESLHPLHSIGSQAMYFVLPFAEIIFDSQKYQRFALMIQKEENIKALVKRIDELDEELNRERRAEARLKSKRRKNLWKARLSRIFKSKNKAE
ncbi:MAG: hypothetical protein PHU99_05990 [Candidatus Cloacimonetes bacterium]|jgi:hypothetical protein|nr:hypothetical protein [Candidatus Cloacimonadota bacterium]MDY0337511.1 hypothetical protein [Candidatus Cloacimonadaceae bacterium]MCB5270024.1 hypothetical protein [Candidatus Cloacimonadota bacterium]MCK9334602.1 hypothetical protein [Candidatus Cloacimonadota bacterium]MDD2544141.1 hypothetical protein [Candidatus Cloacimonadota bacterium]